MPDQPGLPIPNGGEVRVQETRYEPVHISLEKLDQPVIRIEQAPFLAAKRLGRRKFVSSLYGEVFLQEDCLRCRPGHPDCAAKTILS